MLLSRNCAEIADAAVAASIEPKVHHDDDDHDHHDDVNEGDDDTELKTRTPSSLATTTSLEASSSRAQETPVKFVDPWMIDVIGRRERLIIKKTTIVVESIQRKIATGMNL